MGGSGGIGMGTWDVLDGSDGDLVGCCDECLGRVGGVDYNDGVGCDDWAGDGTYECGTDGDVVVLVEGSNVVYVEVYSRGESGVWNGGDDYGCIDDLMDGVDVGDGAGGGGGSSDG